MDGADAEAVSVCAALAERNGRIFLARRAPHKGSPGLWELPGGKLEAGESAPDALARELREELGVEARVDPEAFDRYDRYMEGRGYRFLVYRTSWNRDPETSTDHDLWGYFSPRDIPFEALAPLDEPALRRWAGERMDGSGTGSIREKRP
ncbi:MAG: NUDIX domain-containing protein [Treponema sp.]|nr:NUDIX domain-containing protein [Treponema sp.]